MEADSTKTPPLRSEGQIPILPKIPATEKEARASTVAHGTLSEQTLTTTGTPIPATTNVGITLDTTARKIDEINPLVKPIEGPKQAQLAVEEPEKEVKQHAAEQQTHFSTFDDSSRVTVGTNNPTARKVKVTIDQLKRERFLALQEGSISLKHQLRVKSTTREMVRIQSKAFPVSSSSTPGYVRYPLYALPGTKGTYPVAKLSLATFLPSDVLRSSIEERINWEMPATPDGRNLSIREFEKTIEKQIEVLQKYTEPKLGNAIVSIILFRSKVKDFAKKGNDQLRANFKNLQDTLIKNLDQVYTELARTSPDQQMVKQFSLAIQQIQNFSSLTWQGAEIALYLRDQLKDFLIKKEDVLDLLRLFITSISESEPKAEPGPEDLKKMNMIKDLEDMIANISKIPNLYVDDAWIRKNYFSPLDAKYTDTEITIKKFGRQESTTICFSNLLDSFSSLRRYVSSSELSQPIRKNSLFSTFLSTIVSNAIKKAANFIPRMDVENQLRLAQLPKAVVDMHSVMNYYNKQEIVNAVKIMKRNAVNIEERDKFDPIFINVSKLSSEPFISEKQLRILLKNEGDTKVESELKELGENATKFIRYLTPYVVPSDLLKVVPDVDKAKCKPIIEELQAAEIFPGDFVVKVSSENRSELLMSALLPALGKLGRVVLRKFPFVLQGISLEGSGIASTFIKGSSINTKDWERYQIARSQFAKYTFFKSLIDSRNITHMNNSITYLSHKIAEIDKEIARLRARKISDKREEDQTKKSIITLENERSNLNLYLDAFKGCLKGVNPINIEAVAKELHAARNALCDERSRESIISLGFLDLLMINHDGHEFQTITDENGLVYNVDYSRFMDRHPLLAGNNVFAKLRSFALDHPFAVEPLSDSSSLLQDILALNAKDILNEWINKGLIEKPEFFAEHKKLSDKYSSYQTEIDNYPFDEFLDHYNDIFKDDLDLIKIRVYQHLNRQLNNLNPSTQEAEFELIMNQKDAIKKAKDIKSIAKWLGNDTFLKGVLKNYFKNKKGLEDDAVASKLPEASANAFATRLQQLQNFIRNVQQLTLVEAARTLYPHLTGFVEAMERGYGEGYENVCVNNNEYISLERCFQIIQSAPYLHTQGELQFLSQRINSLKTV